MEAIRGLRVLCFTLWVVFVNCDWRSDAQARIDEIRRVNITVKASGEGSAEVQVLMKKNGFFGSCVDSNKIVDSRYRAYQDVFYKHFTWGVLENALKWKWMEETRGVIDYDTPLRAIAAMQDHGIRIRCHCVFWAKREFNAAWVNALRGDAMKAAITERINGVIGKTKGLCEHWDVNNENLHETLFEDATGDHHITQKMFQQIHEKDPKPLLFINDYYILSEQPTAIRLRDQALQYLSEDVPIGGIGIQGHIRNLGVETIKSRIELVGQAGLPIMITELGVNNRDVNGRARDLVNTLTMFYSLPEIHGVLFWGFWDGSIWETDAPLYEGNSVTPNAAGVAFERLLYETWGTDVTKTISAGEKFTVQGHRGEYVVRVKQNGQTIMEEDFIVHNSTIVKVTISGDSPTIIVG